MIRHLGALCAFLVIAAAPFAVLDTARAAGSITISDAWSRPADDTGVVYAHIANADTRADLIDGARTPVARAVELHRSMVMNDMSTMKPVYALNVPAGGTAAFAPGSDHIMLIGLKRELKADETFPIDLHFKHAGWVSTTVQVRVADAVANASTVTNAAAGANAASPVAGDTPFPEMAHARNTEGQSQGQIVLDAVVFILGILILGGILAYIGKRIFTEKS